MSIKLLLYSYSGSDLVDWLFANVEGFQDRREARKYASKLLKVSVFIENLKVHGF